MTPMFIGGGARRLFAVFHPSSRPNGRAALLCYPWGHEYIFAHRSMANLAQSLNRAGLDVLRFDYFGTGDSSGEFEDADVEGWLDDIDVAVDELLASTGAQRVTLIGLRFGATLAAKYAQEHSRLVDSLVLWDPTVSGADYWAMLSEGDLHVQSGSERARNKDGAPEEVCGFPLCAEMETGLRTLDMRDIVPHLSQRIFTIVTQSDERGQALRDVFTDNVRSGEFEIVPDHAAWNEDWPHNAGVLPVHALNRITSWLT